MVPLTASTGNTLYSVTNPRCRLPRPARIRALTDGTLPAAIKSALRGHEPGHHQLAGRLHALACLAGEHAWHGAECGDRQCKILGQPFSRKVPSCPSIYRLVQPHFIGGGVLQFSFTNAAGASFTILGSTNVALPLAQWQNLGHPTESPAPASISSQILRL